ncbi:NAD(P)H-binding protein [Rhizobium sp. RCAM05973]|uniref:NAD(P)H-binding protein n=1 Tax=Rhizobium sp. RCAM05973 TaxID=2994066 RepID=UPI0032B79B61
MYAITGITGQVGGAVARSLLADKLAVRAVLRNEAKAAEWKAQGCDIAIADMDDATRLSAAFRGAEAVFILPPSEFDPEPGFPEAMRVIEAIVAALAEARPKRVVCLSTIGADAPHENLLSQRTPLEQALGAIDLPVTFLRPGWFMENALWDVAAARDEGVLEASCSRPTRHSRWSPPGMSGNLPPRFFARSGAGCGLSSWKGLSGCRRMILLEASRTCWYGRCRWRSCRVKIGNRSSVLRA